MKNRVSMVIVLVILGLLLTIPSGCKYYFPWNDNTYMRTWILMANPSTNTSDTTATVQIAGALKGTYHLTPGQRVTPEFPGMAGPVAIDATNTAFPGQVLVTSQRSIYKNSFSEIPGLADTEIGLANPPRMSDLETEYWFTWYDLQSVGMNGNWILVGNTSTTETANVQIQIGASATYNYSISPGGNITPNYPGVMDGPVHVICTNGVPIYCTQRVLYKDSFSEVWGIPDYDLGDDFFFTWYDEQSAGMKTWVLVGADPGNASNAIVEIRVGGALQGSYSVAPGSRVTPHFPGVMNGPVEVKCTNGQNIFASERSLYLDSFEEVCGMNPNYFDTAFFFTWYDQQSTGMKDWILVANTSETASANVTIKVGTSGTYSYTVGPSSRITPQFPGLMDGLVEVTSDIPVYTSQRVLYQNSFNEVWAIDNLGSHP
jgi:hypothetical protein